MLRFDPRRRPSSRRRAITAWTVDIKRYRPARSPSVIHHCLPAPVSSTVTVRATCLPRRLRTAHSRLQILLAAVDRESGKDFISLYRRSVFSLRMPHQLWSVSRTFWGAMTSRRTLKKTYYPTRNFSSGPFALSFIDLLAVCKTRKVAHNGRCNRVASSVFTRMDVE